MIFVLTMLFTFVYDRKNENHWSLLGIRYSLLGIQTPGVNWLILLNAPVKLGKDIEQLFEK